ncbi:xyloglucan O-acetyltransferase 2-like isoform X1 [Lotus japonicus]|uniref:xyloglucan O-acetyltransferase 2-like isoform X1 n=1 Tax=Lotus japonicus TaxID=34305 RepID=UPI00258AF473|nr:xyloglucan O-acetyltransferase 2-like isoform X1 [Lotus japonicus]
MHVFKMRSAKAYRYQSLSLLWRLVPCTFLALLCLYFYPHFNNSSPPTDPHPYSSYITYNPSLSAPVLFPPPSYSGILLAEKHKAPLLALSPNSEKDKGYKKECDYFKGKWVPDRRGPLYNGTTCGDTIQNTHNCMTNGRPDMGYLYWRWKPRRCNLPRER